MDVDSEQWNKDAFTRHCLRYVGGSYAWGKEDPRLSDCSGILRAWHRLEYTADDFYHKLYTETEGRIGAVFLVDDQDHAYHVMPLVGQDVIINAQHPRIRLEPWLGNGILRFL